MSRRQNKQTGGQIGYAPQGMPQQSQSGRAGGGGNVPYGLTISLGKKGLTVAGNGISPVTVPIQVSQQKQRFQGQQQQQQTQQGQPWQGGGGTGNIVPILQSCILAAAANSQIAQQQFALHQQTQATNQQLLTSLTQFAAQMGLTNVTGMSKKQMRQFTNPQQHLQPRQRGQKNQQQQRTLQYA